MKKVIDADSFKKVLEEEVSKVSQSCNLNQNPFIRGVAQGLVNACTFLNKSPAVESTSIETHARWITFCGKLKCSNCGSQIPYGKVDSIFDRNIALDNNKYCYNCGAKMI